MNFKDELSNLRNLLTKVEENKESTSTSNFTNKENEEKTLQLYEDKLKEIQKNIEKFVQVDNDVANVLNTKDYNVTLNIGGQLFHTKLSTVLSEKDTLFYILYAHKIQNKDNLEEVLFIDRNPALFNTILNYLRTKMFNAEYYSINNLDDLKNEAEFFGITAINEKIAVYEREVVFINFEASPRYSNLGTHNLQDLNDRSLTKGFCLQSPYYIVLELNYDCEISQIDIGGYNGNTNSWAPSNGASAKIQTSLNKSEWTEVGTVPTNYSSNIVRVSLNKTRAKYLKIQHTTYLGIGHLKIIKQS